MIPEHKSDSLPVVQGFFFGPGGGEVDRGIEVGEGHTIYYLLLLYNSTIKILPR